VELTVLGSHGTWPGPSGETCGYLVNHEGFNVWLDAGTGTLARLQERLPIEKIDAVLVTHGHPDHFLDMIPCFYARHYGGLGEPGLPFFSPEGFVSLASQMVSENGRDVMREAYGFKTLTFGEEFEIGPFRVRAHEMTHIGVPSLGFRIETGGAVLAYTGDTGPSPEVIEMTRGADVMLCEATYQEHTPQAPFHMSAMQAGGHATASGAGRLILTHILPILDGEVSREEAAATFDGVIDLAYPGLSIEVGE
jgi:ribonuclease BN (tRNA processing enzyme)